MNKNSNLSGELTKVRIESNGKTYNSLDELPENLKSHFADKNKNGIPDIIENTPPSKVTKYSVELPMTYEFEGRVYKSLDEMPPDLRAMFQQAKGDTSTNGSSRIYMSDDNITISRNTLRIIITIIGLLFGIYLFLNR